MITNPTTAITRFTFLNVFKMYSMCTKSINNQYLSVTIWIFFSTRHFMCCIPHCNINFACMLHLLQNEIILRGGIPFTIMKFTSISFQSTHHNIKIQNIKYRLRNTLHAMYSNFQCAQFNTDLTWRHGILVTTLSISTKLLQLVQYMPGPVSTELGDRFISQVFCLGMWSATKD